MSVASAYPISFAETPAYQRIYVVPEEIPAGPPTSDTDEALEAAVPEATEQLHDDMAYEFEMRWQLWAPRGAEGGRCHLDGAEDDPGRGSGCSRRLLCAG